MMQVLLDEQLLKAGLAVGGSDQIPGHNFALVGIPIDDFAGKLGLQLQESFDELDYLRLAVLELPGGGRAALMAHRGGPATQTEVWLSNPSEESWATLQRDAGIDSHKIIWNASQGRREPES